MTATSHYRRLTVPPKGSLFLFGVRGVGKSTRAGQEFPDAHFVDLLDEGRYQTLLANPGLLALELQALSPLAGCATLRTMYPLLPAELQADFHLDHVLRFGSIPLSWNAEEPEAALDAYVQLYVREEIRLDLYLVASSQ